MHFLFLITKSENIFLHVSKRRKSHLNLQKSKKKIKLKKISCSSSEIAVFSPGYAVKLLSSGRVPSVPPSPSSFCGAPSC